MYNFSILRPALNVRFNQDASSSFRSFAAACLLGAAIAQGLAAVIFFYAANWWDMNAAVRLGLLMTALIGCALGAGLAPRGFARSGFATAGAILGGVLFAVHGQIWQTGANAWELFAIWTLVAFVWAVLSETDGAWIVGTVVGSVGLWLWAVQMLPGWDDHISDIALGQAGFLALTLGARYLAALRPASPKPAAWFAPVLLWALIVALGFSATIASEWWRPRLAGTEYVMAGIVCGLAMIVLIPPRKYGPWPFALGLILVVYLLELFLINLLCLSLDGVSEIAAAGLFLLSAVFVLAGVAFIWRVLMRQFSGDVLSERARIRLHALMGVAVGTGAWLAIALLASAVLTALTLFSTPDYIAAPIMFVAFVLGAGLIRDRSVFTGHLHAAMVTGAFVAATICFALLMDNWGNVSGERLGNDIQARNTAVFMALFAPICLAFTRSRVAGVLAGATAFGAGLAAILFQLDIGIFGPSNHIDGTIFLVYAVGVAVVALAGCLSRRPSFRAAAVVLLLGAFGIPILAELFRIELWDDVAFTLIECRVTAVLIALPFLVAALRRKDGLPDWPLIGAAAVMLGVALLVPAGAAALVAFGALAILGLGRSMVVIGFIFAAWSVSRFYYGLEIPLDIKSLYMLLGAALTVVAWRMIATAPVTRPVWCPPVLAALLVCALFPIGLEVWGGRQKARIARDGQEILIALAPVDPRSLIQGDYMELAYDLPGLRTIDNTSALAYLNVREDSVADAIRAARSTGEGAGEENANAVDKAESATVDVPVRTRRGDREARIAPTSFLFQEGTAHVWEKAEYAVVRVLDGNLLLVGLADADMVPLDPNDPQHARPEDEHRRESGR